MKYSLDSKLKFMANRRDFLKTSGAFALGTFMLPGLNISKFHKYPMPEPGLQLFTFFNVIDNDVPGTLKKISEIGYKNIESAFSKKGGYYGMKPKEFSTMLNGMGLKWKSHHVLGAPFKLPPGAKLPTDADGKPISIPPMRNLRDNHQELVDEAAEGGVEYLVCANTPINTLEEIKSSIEVLNKTGAAAKKAGLQFAYHNHEAEFHAIEGQVPYDLFLKETDPASVKMELDIAWAVKGGKDPVELFKANAGRFPLWHVKDLDKERNNIKPLGEGTIDYKPFFAQAETAGMKYYFIEHDMPADAYASIATSLKSIHQMLH
jgi:sugar phosphate isomerase/epimerase